MPDYAACMQDKCYKREECARFRMVWGERQSVVKPEKHSDACELYWNIEDDVPFKLREVEDV